ncbi:MAG TPA: DUF4349 domain-containing protein [Pyrinomonadaceae bacterium]|nr:DUF4349 domain-containing protein [Pyrinomonadaceae bacterium]
MKAPLILSLALVIFATSCSQSRQDGGAVAQLERTQVEAKPQSSSPQAEKTSLAEVDKATSTAEALDRKIIRNADITIEAASTTEAQYRVTEIAEAHGGFVITSEAKQRENMDASKRTFDIELVARVPSAEFGPALEEIKKLASNIPEAHITSQDVTEDFIDLEARIKTQKAVELQFLEIMKQANKVPDALEVQRQIAEVRTDIEKLEGRKRFLENRSSLSTITVNIQAPKLITVSTTGFRSGLRDAVSDSLELASGMVVFFVRLLIVMAPVLVFIVLPVGLAFRYLMRRVKRIRLAQALATPTAE